MQTTYRHDKSYLVMIKNKEQVLNLLGIARRARQLQSGEEIVLKNIQTKKAKFVLINVNFMAFLFQQISLENNLAGQQGKHEQFFV